MLTERCIQRPFRIARHPKLTVRRHAVQYRPRVRGPFAFPRPNAYLIIMLSTFEFCLPTTAAYVPDRPNWLHEVKYDGYRLRLERDGDRVRLITRGGYNWTGRYPWIVESALKNRHHQFVVDGEAVVLGVDGVADFNALHSRQHNDEEQLYAFDILALNGEDLRGLPLSLRKTNLARLLARRPDGIFVAPFEQGEIGPDLFRAACGMGLEGLVSKRADRPYRAGRSKDWIKVKNRKHPAIHRVQDAFSR
jgi:bifunctional non-homologous end joining protein LigD